MKGLCIIALFIFSYQAAATQTCKMDLGSVLQTARVEPGACRKAGPCGWLFKKIDQGSFYDLIGLRVDDLVLRINGKKIDNPAPFMKEFYEFKPGEKKNLEIDRDGKVKQIDYSCPYKG